MRDKIRGIKGFYMGAANPTPLDKLRREDAPRGSQATISAPTPEDSAWQQFKTFVSNPFDGARALVNDARTSIRESVGLDNDNITSGPYANLSNLRRANESTDEQTKQALNRSSAFNSASSMTPVALTAQTFSDAISGDVTSLATKKLNKIPGVKNIVQDPKLAKNLAKTAYNTLKTDKNVLSKT
tara:strand:- start:55 stop:609 length:555 start_codon:yes stop_codon:yes gene_type:complete